MNTSIKLYSFGYTELKTYLFALLFAAGNLLLPQLCHFVPNGGHTLLPIFFFTLIAAYKFGIRVGLLTAVLSPVLNHLLFSMPGTEMLPVILVKSGLLAIAGAATAKYAKKISVLALVCIVTCLYCPCLSIGRNSYFGSIHYGIFHGV